MLVQRLRHRHGLLRREAELAARLLLQRRGRERRGRAAGLRLRLDGVHRRGRCGLERRGERTGRGLVEGDDVALERTSVIEVGAARDAATIDPGKPGREAGGRGDDERRDVPVRGRDEGDALALTLDDQTDRGRLHAAGGESLRYLAPEHGRDLETEEAVEDAPGLLRVDEVEVELARLLDGREDRVLGDLVKDHALDGHLRLEHLAQVPCDGLAFAVLISGEQELVGVLERTLEFGDGAAGAVARELVVGLEAVVDVHGEAPERALLHLGRHLAGLWKVADVPHRAEHLVSVAKIRLDRLHLGR